VFKEFLLRVNLLIFDSVIINSSLPQLIVDNSIFTGFRR